MYETKEANQISKIASNAMDNTRSDIAQLSRAKSESQINSSKNLLNWQSWLGNVSFSLAAVGGVILLDANTSSYFPLAGLFGFLIVGIWIAINQKKLFESSVNNASEPYDQYLDMYNEKKRLAFELWESPNDPKKHIEFLEQEKNIQEYAKEQLLEESDNLQKARVNYRNDFWIAIIAASVYFILQPIAQKRFFDIGISESIFNYMFWIALVVILLMVGAGARKSRNDFKKTLPSKIQRNKEQLRHTELYTDRVQQDIKAIKKRFKIKDR